jgi:hypothetical protein
MRRYLWAAVSSLLTLPGQVLEAQIRDQGTLSIRQAGREIGHEEYRLVPSRGGRASGDSVTAFARYPESHPSVSIRAVLDRSPGSPTFSYVVEVRGPQGTSQVLAAGSHNRVILRTVGAGSETARELPGGEQVVVLDDSVFSLYSIVAQLATESGRPLTALFPRSARRVSFVARRQTRQTAGGAETVIGLSGGISGTLWLDAGGRLERVELPSSSLEVVRLRD